MCVCVPVSRELWITELSHQCRVRISRPHCHCDCAKSFYWLPGGLSDARQVILLFRYSNLPAPITPSPLHPCTVFWACACGECDAISAEVLPAAWLRNLLSLCHIRIHTTPRFYIIVWLSWYLINSTNWFKKSMSFGYLITTGQKE